MHRLCQLFFIFLITFFSRSLTAQVWNGNISLGSQAEVNNFDQSYPGVKKINGQLLIGKNDTLLSSDITDLSPLANLLYVETFFIGNNGQLATLSGLKITEADALAVFRNPKLIDLKGLDSLRYAYSLTIQRNPQLPNLNGLGGLIEAEQLTVNYNQNLQSLAGLDNLVKCNYYGMYIEYNPRLKSVNGMPKLERVALRLTSNDSIVHFGNLPALKSAGIGVYSHKNFIDFADLQNTQIEYCGFDIADNPKFESFKGFEYLNATTIHARNNPRLKNLIDFKQDSFVNLVLTNNALEHISFPKAYQGNQVEIYNEKHLKNLTNMFPAVDSIRKIWIYGNDSLTTIHEDFGPRRISELELRDPIWDPQYNPRLEEVSGFERLELVGYDTDYKLSFSVSRLIKGFNKFQQGELFLGNYYNEEIDFEGIIGFNGMVSGSVTVSSGYLNGKAFYPQKIIGFKNLKTIDNSLDIHQVCDTLDGFHNLINVGPSPGAVGLVSIRVPDTCFVSPKSFSLLEKAGGIWNCGIIDRTKLIPFPSLVSASVGAFDNSFVQDLKNVYPKLKQVGNIAFTNCPKLKTLDGLEGITKFMQPWSIGATGYHMYIENCDSLSDCSALCEIFKHATFYPQQFTNYINNPLFPCDKLANVKAYCDTLTSAVAEPIKPEKEPQEIRVFPNPESSGFLNIQLEKAADGVFPISVSDISGRTALSGSALFQNGTATIRTDMLATGSYQLAIFLENKLVSAKFLRF